MHYSHKRGPNSYDINWRPKIQFATSVLTDIQNDWLTEKVEIEASSLTAIVFAILSADFVKQIQSKTEAAAEQKLKSRSSHDWILSVHSPALECTKLLAHRTVADCERVSQSIVAIVGEAIESWNSNALNPGCEELVHRIMTFLSDGGHIALVR